MSSRGLVVALAVLTACAPKLVPPSESTRVEGEVRAKAGGPITITVYDRCSTRLYFLDSCPGKFLGEARIGKPGRFLVEVDPGDSAVSIFAYRGAIGAIEQCATTTVPVAGRRQGITLELKPGPCPAKIKRP